MGANEEIPRKRFAELLGVHVRTLDAWAREGLRGVRLVPLRRGGRVRYTMDSYRRWQAEVDARSQPPDGRSETRARKEARRQAREVLRARGIRVPGEG